VTDIATRVETLSPWYHTFELPDGVVTKGFYDLREVSQKVPMPGSLVGKRCLDAASADGFWAFEMARRGADEVVSLDLDDPSQKDWQGIHAEDDLKKGTGDAAARFALVREALGFSNVKRVDMNLYDINPEALGRFDYVFIGSVLLHLGDPGRALKAIRTVLKPDGELLSFEAISLLLSAVSRKVPLGQLWDGDDLSRWWTPNMAGHRRLVHAAGYEIIAKGGPMFQPFGQSLPKRPPSFSSLLRHPRLLLFWTTVRWFGCASGWVRARPAVGTVSR